MAAPWGDSMKQRISVLASAIVAHVLAGGWLGASWPLYIRGPRLNAGEYEAAYRLACDRCWRRRGEELAFISRQNFAREAA
jgi:hypothetical protein